MISQTNLHWSLRFSLLEVYPIERSLNFTCKTLFSATDRAILFSSEYTGSNEVVLTIWQSWCVHIDKEVSLLNLGPWSFSSSSVSISSSAEALCYHLLIRLNALSSCFSLSKVRMSASLSL